MGGHTESNVSHQSPCGATVYQMNSIKEKNASGECSVESRQEVLLR